MALPTSGAITANQIKTEFSLPTASFATFTRSNTAPSYGSAPAVISAGNPVSLSNFYGNSGRTASIGVGISTASVNAPNRYGWSLANYSGFYHAEAGVNTAAFGSISRYSGLIGNSLVAICTHDVGENHGGGSTYDEHDVHLEIFSTSSSNSGWTYMDVKFAGDFQYQSPGYVAHTFTRSAASHFGQVGGLGTSYQPTNTVYAWTFTGKIGSSWYGVTGSHPVDNDSVRSVHTAFKSAQGGSALSTPYIRFR